MEKQLSKLQRTEEKYRAFIQEVHKKLSEDKYTNLNALSYEHKVDANLITYMVRLGVIRRSVNRKDAFHVWLASYPNEVLFKVIIDYYRKEKKKSSVTKSEMSEEYSFEKLKQSINEAKEKEKKIDEAISSHKDYMIERLQEKVEIDEKEIASLKKAFSISILSIVILIFTILSLILIF